MKKFILVLAVLVAGSMACLKAQPNIVSGGSWDEMAYGDYTVFGVKGYCEYNRTTKLFSIHIASLGNQGGNTVVRLSGFGTNITPMYINETFTSEKVFYYKVDDERYDISGSMTFSFEGYDVSFPVDFHVTLRW